VRLVIRGLGGVSSWSWPFFPVRSALLSPWGTGLPRPLFLCAPSTFFQLPRFGGFSGSLVYACASGVRW